MTKLPVEDENWLVEFVRRDYKVAQKRKEADQKNTLIYKVHMGPRVPETFTFLVQKIPSILYKK